MQGTDTLSSKASVETCEPRSKYPQTNCSTEGLKMAQDEKAL